METRDLRTLAVVTAVIVILTILGVWVFLILLAALVPSRPLPDGMMPLITAVAMGAIGMPAAFAMARTLKGNGKNGDEEDGS